MYINIIFITTQMFERKKEENTVLSLSDSNVNSRKKILLFNLRTFFLHMIETFSV